MGKRRWTHPSDYSVGRPASEQLRLLGTERLHGSLQPENSHQTLRVWYHAGNWIRHDRWCQRSSHFLVRSTDQSYGAESDLCSVELQDRSADDAVVPGRLCPLRRTLDYCG